MTCPRPFDTADHAVYGNAFAAPSVPFAAGEQIAAKVLDDRGNVLIVVKQIGEMK